MKNTLSRPWLLFALVAAASFASMAGSCGGGSSHTSMGPTPTPGGPTPLVGCNPGASSVQIASESLSFARRMYSRAPRPQYIPGEVAVRFSGSGTEPEIAQTMSRLRAVQAAAPSGLGYAVYSIPETQNPVTAAAMLAATRGIAEAKPLVARYLQDTIPNDTDFGPAPPYTGPDVNAVQWDMYYIQMPKTWDTYKGAAGVAIAIIDTGYDANNIDVCSKVVNSAVFDTGGGTQVTNETAQDDDGHGTNVSGIAAAVTNNATRFAGVGWNTDLLEVRVFKQATAANPNPPGASNFDIAAGINWAVANGAKVISMSLGAQGACDSTEQNAISSAVAAGVVVVVASGNDGLATISAPADCHGVISVGASALDDTTNPASPTEYVASYSNYGSNGDGLTLVAPGGDPDAAQQMCGTVPACDFLQWIVNNYSTTACCANSTPPNQPGHGVFIAGTSQATPHVAGVAALMLAKKPGLSPATIKQDLQLYVDDIGAGVKQGAGRLNAFRTLTNT